MNRVEHWQPLLRVLLNDPAAVVLSLRNHMQRVDLIELILIVAEGGSRHPRRPAKVASGHPLPSARGH